MKRFLPRLTGINIRCLVTVDTPSPVLQHWAKREEKLERYRPKGYHPAAIGEILGSRYRILRKLGWGVYSTVWLVQNQSDDSYAALKVMTAEASNAPELHELEYLQRIEIQDTHHPGYPHVLHLLDHFYHQGPNGKHLCLVTDVLAESTASFMDRFKNHRMPVAVVKRVTRQVILALDCLHNACNIVHTDIKPSNLLFALNIAKDPGLLAVAETLSRMPRVNKDGVWDSIEIKLVDVGVACWADRIDEHFTDLIQSPALRAPEVCIGAGWGKLADVWSLGCTVYELVMGKSLLSRDIADVSVPYLHMLFFGNYPPAMIKEGKYSSAFFNDDGSQKYPMTERITLEDDIRKRGAPPGLDDFIDFLKLMLRLDPALRASFNELLAHRWLSCD